MTFKQWEHLDDGVYFYFKKKKSVSSHRAAKYTVKVMDLVFLIKEILKQNGYAETST